MEISSSVFKYWLSKQMLAQIIQVIQRIRAQAEGIPGNFGCQLKETERDTHSGLRSSAKLYKHCVRHKGSQALNELGLAVLLLCTLSLVPHQEGLPWS